MKLNLLRRNIQFNLKNDVHHYYDQLTRIVISSKIAIVTGILFVKWSLLVVLSLILELLILVK